MTVDNFVYIYNKETNIYSSNIPREIAGLFENYKDYCKITDLTNTDKCNIIINSKYNYVVHKITKYSLCDKLTPFDVNNICKKIDMFIEEIYNDNDYLDIIYYVEQGYDSAQNKITYWTELFTDEYIPGPTELIKLGDFFKILVNLELYININ